MKVCKDCNLNKSLSEYYIQGISKRTSEKWYRGRCKKCHNLRFQPPKGGVNSGWFKKGHINIQSPFIKGHIPWNKGKRLTKEQRNRLKTPLEKLKGISRNSIRAKMWRIEVLKKDGFKCQFCGIKTKLEVHHIIPFHDSEALRFDINNGTVYCKRCHNRIERTRDVNKI